MINQNKNLLAIDIGNSTIGIGLFKNNRLKNKYSIETKEGCTNKIEEKIKSLKFHSLYVSSVVPWMDEEILKLSKKLKITPFFIDHQIKTSIKIKIDNPLELGADRIVNANGGLMFFKPPLIIIDSGTATTFDLVDENYDYIGGSIFPGINISLKSLANNTAKLKKIKFYKPQSSIGKNSAECIRAGLYYGYIGSLNYFIELYKKILGKQSKVIVTGGLVGFLKDSLKGVDLYQEDLIFYGIYSIYQTNLNKVSR